MSTQLLNNGTVYAYRPVKEIAKDVRADIKTAIKNGTLPSDLKVSVSVSHHSTIIVKYYTNEVKTHTINCSYCRCSAIHFTSCSANLCGSWWTLSLSNDGVELESTIKKIVNAYNYNNSDAARDYFDVNYYTNINFDYNKNLKASNIDGMDEPTAEALLTLVNDGMPVHEAYRTALALAR